VISAPKPVIIPEIVTSKAVKLPEITGILEEDHLIPSPMSEVECICCKVKGDRKVIKTLKEIIYS
jgi:hypothetical protein